MWAVCAARSSPGRRKKSRPSLRFLKNSLSIPRQDGSMNVAKKNLMHIVNRLASVQRQARLQLQLVQRDFNKHPTEFQRALNVMLNNRPTSVQLTINQYPITKNH